jgi:hypothetical protein
VSYIFIFRKQFYVILSYMTIIGHENSDNNLESLCICCRHASFKFPFLQIQTVTNGCLYNQQLFSNALSVGLFSTEFEL